MRRLGKLLGVLLLGAIVTGMTAWGMGALSYAPLPAPLGTWLALTFGLATVGAFLGLSHRRRTLLGFVLVWGALVLWWSTIAPSNSRDWQPDVAVLPYATMDGDRVTLHNIRNIEYRTETDFTLRYYDKTFDLQQLESVDMIVRRTFTSRTFFTVWSFFLAARTCGLLSRVLGADHAPLSAVVGTRGDAWKRIAEISFD